MREARIVGEEPNRRDSSSLFYKRSTDKNGIPRTVTYCKSESVGQFAKSKREPFFRIFVFAAEKLPSSWLPSAFSTRYVPVIERLERVPVNVILSPLLVATKLT
jgi:hypothetical protein